MSFVSVRNRRIVTVVNNCVHLNRYSSLNYESSLFGNSSSFSHCLFRYRTAVTVRSSIVNYLAVSVYHYRSFCISKLSCSYGILVIFLRQSVSEQILAGFKIWENEVTLISKPVVFSRICYRTVRRIAVCLVYRIAVIILSCFLVYKCITRSFGIRICAWIRIGNNCLSFFIYRITRFSK